jgi:hypothetical protein
VRDHRSAVDGSTHGYSRPPVQASRALEVPDPPELGRLLTIGDDGEAEALVVRRVPRNHGERGQRELVQPLIARPFRCRADQATADAPASVARVHGHLLDVTRAGDDVQQEVGHDLATLLGDPGPAGVLVLRQEFERQRVVVSDGVHSQRSERLARQAFDALQRGKIGGTSKAESDHVFILPRPPQPAWDAVSV